MTRARNRDDPDPTKGVRIPRIDMPRAYARRTTLGGCSSAASPPSRGRFEARPDAEPRAPGPFAKTRFHVHRSGGGPVLPNVESDRGMGLVSLGEDRPGDGQTVPSGACLRIDVHSRD